MKKLVLHSEIAYLFATILIALGVALVAVADFGVSMIVAPAYVISLATPLSFGVSEYVVQGIVFIVFCLLMKKFKPLYLCSFLSCLLYGCILDLWRLIPLFSPTAPSLPVYLRIVFFAVGTLITAFSVALYFNTYFYPQVYDFFVKGISAKYKLKRTVFKIIFDFSFLIIAVIISFIAFGKLNGVGIGTLVTAAVNGLLIGFFNKIISKFFTIKSFLPKLEKLFILE